MFKFTLVIVLLIAVSNINGIDIEIPEELKDLVMSLHNSCREETGATEEMIEKARKGDFADEQPLKCYMKCLMSQMSTMDDDGIIDVEAVIALMPDVIKDKVAPAIRTCGTKVGADACDNAFLTNKCYYAEKPDYYFLV